ncbi:MAG: Nif3-like dinuclear metal center hexameric protein [Clostridia bacterium]|nr:Nif3-like dinuclear metal center hexameric protein [Clostridia bacterium]
MNLTSILKKLEEVAPVALSNAFCKTYSMYDNSGILVDCGTEINGAVFSLDLTDEVLAEVEKLGYNLIVTHHPVIFGGIQHIYAGDLVAECFRKGISVISMHLNFDAAPEGVDYHLMCGLGGNTAIKVLEPVEGGAYGRVYDIKPIVFGDYKKHVNKTFSTDRALFYGDDNKIIKRVASFCGAGSGNSSINFAKANGADVFVSSDMKHHEITALLHNGINVIHLTHYSAESYGFNKIYLKIKDGLQIPSSFYFDKGLA